MGPLVADFVDRLQLCLILQTVLLPFRVSVSLGQEPFGNTDHSKALPLEAAVESDGG
jgi:hypothetical protein